MFSLFIFVFLFHYLLGLVQGEPWLNFTIAQVVQCEPITINFSSNVVDMRTPMLLEILPLNSSPVAIPIPNIALDTTGLTVTFLPLPAGQQFIASLSGANDKIVAQVSDLTRVLSSPTGNTSCLPTPIGNSFRTHNDNFKLISKPMQCEDVVVTYDTDVIQSAPTVRAFAPEGDSVLLPQTSDNTSNGTATFTMVVRRGTQILLVFDDGMQHRETTGLMTVEGDSSSSVDCLPKSPPEMNATTTIASTANTANNTSQGGGLGAPQLSGAISQEVIIGCSVGGGVILLIIILMAVFVVRDRKRRRQRRGTIISFFSQRLQDMQLPREGTTRNPFEETPMVERGESGNPGGGCVTNPPYVREELDGSFDGKTPLAARSSFSSWTHDGGSNAGDTSMHRRPSVDPVQSLDIEGMLDMATALSGKQIIKQSRGSQAELSQSLRSRDPDSSAADDSGEASRVRHWRAPSDVPADLTVSGTFSGYSIVVPNPFSDDQHIELPSSFIQADEPARPGSDVVRPPSVERKVMADPRSLNDRNPEKQGEERSTESREET